MADWLKFINLSDEYERRARFLPALTSVLPIAPLFAAWGASTDWFAVVLAGTGIGAILSVAISHLASAAGNWMQGRLWPKWPHDAPTNRWLHPDDRSRSRQQKDIWYHQIQTLVGIDLLAAVRSGQNTEIEAAINDAVTAVRHRLWEAPAGSRVKTHNIDYGFARNLAGLSPVWLGLSFASVLGSWAAVRAGNAAQVWAWTATGWIIAAVPLAVSVLPGYVRRKADYYAESFFGALATMTA